MALGLDPSVVPPLQIDVSNQSNGQRFTRHVPKSKSSDGGNASKVTLKRAGSEVNLTAMAASTSGGDGGGGSAAGQAVPTKSSSERKSITLDAAAENGGGSGANSSNATPVNSNSAGRDARVNRDAVIAAFAAVIAAAAEQGDKPVALVIDDVDRLDSSGWHLLRVLCSIRDANETSPSEAGVTHPPNRCFIMVSHHPFSPSRQVMSPFRHVHALTTAHHFCIPHLHSPYNCFQASLTAPLLYSECVCEATACMYVYCAIYLTSFVSASEVERIERIERSTLRGASRIRHTSRR